MTWEFDAGVAPSGAVAAWAELVGAVRAGAPGNRLDDARSAVVSVLAPSRSMSVPDLAAVRFAEQMTADVSALSDAQRAAALAELGPTAFPFVQAVWVCDVGTRARSALRQLFDDGVLADAMEEGPLSGVSAWPAQEQFLREVAKLTALDPVTSELVRLRGARAHACRLCQSLRSRSALQTAGGSEMFDSPDGRDHGNLTARHRAALDFVDAFIWQPIAWPEALADRLRAIFSPLEGIELVLDVMRNSANKIAVALAADAAHVTEGVEYYDIDPVSGDLLYGLAPVL